MSETLTKVSVVIPTFNRDQILIKTLADLMAQDYPDFEVIVVDQTKKPSREVLDFVKKYSAKLRYFMTQENGSHRARNLAVKNAQGEILLFVDDDVEIKDKNFIGQHVSNYQDEKIGLVGGRVVYDWKDQGNTREVGKLKWFGLKEVTNFNSTRRSEIDHAYGCNFSCRKAIYKKVGGFSDVYKGNAHMEETDFSLRVKRAGYRLVFDPKALLLHARVKTGGNRVTDIYDFRYWLVRNFTLFYLKNFPKIFFPLEALQKYCWAVFSGLKRGDYKMYSVMTKAIFDGMKDYRQI